MKKNLEKTLIEMFGEPMKPLFGTKIGDVPGITKTVSAAGVRSAGNDDLGGVCPDCGMMSIDGTCGCPAVVEMEQACAGCGMPASQCTCPGHETCPVCGMMSMDIENPSGCGLNGEGCGKMNEKSCSECGMSEATCECGYMNEAEKEEKVQARKYHGEKYKASAGSLAALKKHGGSKEKAVKAGAFSWAKDPYAAARAAEIVKTGKAKATRGPKAED